MLSIGLTPFGASIVLRPEARGTVRSKNRQDPVFRERSLRRAGFLSHVECQTARFSRTAERRGDYGEDGVRKEEDGMLVF